MTDDKKNYGTGNEASTDDPALLAEKVAAEKNYGTQVRDATDRMSSTPLVKEGTLEEIAQRQKAAADEFEARREALRRKRMGRDPYAQEGG